MDLVETAKIAIGLSCVALLVTLVFEHRRGRRRLEEIVAAIDKGNEGQREHRLRMLYVALEGLRTALDDGSGRTFVITPPESNDNARTSGQPQLRLMREEKREGGERDDGAKE